MSATRRTFHVAFALRLSATILAASAGPATAQVRPQAPGSTEVFRLTEPRIAPLPEARWTVEQRALVARYAPEVRIGNAFLTLLNVPELIEAVMPFVIYTAGDSTLPARHRELLIL